MFKFHLRLARGFAGETKTEKFSPDDMGFHLEEWNALSDEQQYTEIQNYCLERLYENVEWGWTDEDE